MRPPPEEVPTLTEVVGFSEEEGQRYKTDFVGSGALTGQFDPAWLATEDGLKRFDMLLKLRQSLADWGLKKLNANMMKMAEFRSTRLHRP